MITYSKTLYTKDSGGSLRVWTITSNTEGVVEVVFGKKGGKSTSKTYTAKSKNVGKANATTPESQAMLEAEANVVLQLKRGYFKTEEEALNYEDKTPMKLQNYKDQSKKINFPVYMTTKLDGLRMLVDKDLKAQSKAGEYYKIPPHIFHALEKVMDHCVGNWHGLDGEIYAGLKTQGGISLQSIVSAFRKPNKDTPFLQYWIYDIPVSGKTYEQRLAMMRDIYSFVKRSEIKEIVVLPAVEVFDDTHLQQLFNDVVSVGGEGVVVRNKSGVYEFGKRSYDAQKLKNRDTTEALVTGVTVDKNNEGVLQCELENGIKFECKMLKKASEKCNLRLYENSLTLVNKWIEVEYEALSDAGVPGKPVGIRERNVSVNEKHEWVVKE